MFYLLSDLHCEFLSQKQVALIIQIISKKIGQDKSILILCGDICKATHDNFIYFLDGICKLFHKIIYVPGNHEYYDTSLVEGRKLLENSLIKYDNIELLDNKYIKIDDYIIIGSTLWSDISVYDSLRHAKKYINDFTKIDDMTPETYQSEHNKCVNFIKESIKLNKNNKIIVATHHVPSYDLLDKKFNDNDANPCFASQLNHIFDDSILYWFYGHTHIASKTKINNCVFQCNPIGYPSENAKFSLVCKVL